MQLIQGLDTFILRNTISSIEVKINKLILSLLILPKNYMMTRFTLRL